MHEIDVADFILKCRLAEPEVHSGGPWLVRHVLPPQQSLCAVVTEFYLPTSAHMSPGPYSGPSEFFARFPTRRPENLNLDSLYNAVPGGTLLEGAKILPRAFLETLLESAVGSCFVRCQPSLQEPASAWCYDFPELLSPGRDLVESLPSNFGDFDYFDEGCNWYLYTCDDCPVVYVASGAQLASELVQATPDCAFPIKYDDRYYR